MSLLTVTSPHALGTNTTTKVMQTVLLACTPGILALTLYFGWGSLINCVIAIASAAIFESVCLALRKKPIAFYLNDYSAIVTAVLLAIALPPYAPWWLVVVGMLFSIVVAKHLYGGLGYNPFNPAMVGYVVLLISFPVEMTRWAAPATALDGAVLPSLSQALQLSLGLADNIDAYTGATPLDLLKQNKEHLLSDLYQQEPLFAAGKWAGAGWEWVNIAFLLGGCFLIYKRIFTWHAPVAMLASLSILSALFFDGGSSMSPGAPSFHLLSGATMLGAFFILTDPVSSAVSNKGRLIYGAGVGILLFVVRVWGNYPDAVAFAILLMNFAAPFIDYYTVPRTYGHTQSRSGIPGKND